METPRGSDRRATDRRLTCPRCGGPMREAVDADRGGPPVDICRNCHGVWYDDGELKASLGDSYNYDGLIQNMLPGPSKLACPVCGDGLTELQYQTAKFTLVIDHCLKCRGFWLDFGEFDVIREMYVYARARTASRPPAGRPPVPARPAPTVPARPAPPTAFRPVAPRLSLFDEGEAPAPPRPSPFEYDPLDPRSVPPPRHRPRATPPADDTALAHYRALDHESVTEYEEITVPTYLFCLLSQLPVEVFNPRKRRPVVLWGLIGVHVLVFGLMLAMSDGARDRFVHAFAAIPNVSLWPLGLYMLATSAFLHGSVPHLLGNMYILHIFGDNVNDVFMDHGEAKGPLLFVAFYLVTAALAAATHCLFELAHPFARMIPLVGASGAVSAMIAAYWRLFPRVSVYQVFFYKAFKVPIYLYIFFWIGWNLMLGAMSGLESQVSWLCHLGGFAAGWLLIPYFLPFELSEIREEKCLLR